MKILICGLPGSGKSTLAEPFTRLINGVWLNADFVRTKYDDWDFSIQGRIRQAQRMRHLADGIVIAGKTVVADFICPMDENRKAFDADFVVWMDTIKESTYDDTNILFQPPDNIDYRVQDWFDDTHNTLMLAVERYSKWQDWCNDNE
mgnify:FL=1